MFWLTCRSPGSHFVTPQQRLQFRCDWLCGKGCSNKLLLHIATDLRTQAVCVPWPSDSAHPDVIQPKWGEREEKDLKRGGKGVERVRKTKKKKRRRKGGGEAGKKGGGGE